MNEILSQLAAFSNIDPYVLLAILIWSMVWKGIALWKASKKNSVPWFVVLLVVNTAGILEILYTYLFSEMKFDEKRSRKKRR